MAVRRNTYDHHRETHRIRVHRRIPRSWKVSDVEGSLVIDEAFLEGLKDIEQGQRIYVLFHSQKQPRVQ
jgi:tRNA (Thr-GGU) A37 N-methylase